MLDLKEKTVRGWFEKLPDDIKSSIQEEIPSDQEELAKLCTNITEASQAEWLDIIKNNFDLLNNMGRLRRIRLLAYISGQVYPYNVKVFHQIVNDEESTDDGKGGTGSIKQLFLEDIKALNEAIAIRIAHNSLDNTALEAIRTTSYEVSPSMEIK